jgi:hypothetical membrane protein
MDTRAQREPGISLAFAGGMAAILSYVGCTAAAWWLYPGRFIPLHSWLSALGDRSHNPQGALFYDVGCALTAAALLFFILGLRQWRSRRSGRDALLAAAQVAGIASAFFLLMVGVYSQDRLRLHLLYSNSFFSSFPVFILLLSTVLIGHPRSARSIGIAGFLVVLIGLAFHTLFPRSRPLEWITEFGFLAYVGLVAWGTRVAVRVEESASPVSWAETR